MIDIRFTESINQVSKDDWDSISGADYPFSCYTFLEALEVSGVVHATNGWHPHHALMYDDNKLVAVMPAYLKDHSYGEFVFDFQWAAAYEQHGMAYYPKLISAIPFSPVTGPRIFIRNGLDQNAVLRTFINAFINESENKNIASWHILFPDKTTAEKAANAGLLIRRAVHFQWFNNNYCSFENFLSGFNSRHRKNLRKERETITRQGITLQRLEGNEISDNDWLSFYRFYQLTYTKHSGHGGYLNFEFFSLLQRTMPEKIMLVLAKKNNVVIAAALNFKDSTTLYGRYWGCDEDYRFLHFETCYYQGIEYCIENGLQRFDPGAQGEHKIQRGFCPVFTYSNHWISDTRFREAIQQFLQREDKQVGLYKSETESWLPFKHS